MVCINVSHLAWPALNRLVKRFNYLVCKLHRLWKRFSNIFTRLYLAKTFDQTTSRYPREGNGTLSVDGRITSCCYFSVYGVVLEDWLLSRLWSTASCSIFRFPIFLQPVIDSFLYRTAQISFLTTEFQNNCQSQSSLDSIRQRYVDFSQV